MPEGQYDERVIAINRVAKVVKGGRRFSFTALVVVGDGERQRRPRLRQGQGSARPRSRRAWKRREEPLRGAARRLDDHAPDHRRARRGPGAAEAGGARYRRHRRRRRPRDPRAAGIHDVLAKSLGSSNAINVARATMQGLRSLRRPDDIAQLRGKSPEEVSHRRACSTPTASATRRQARDHRGRVSMAERCTSHPGPFDDRHQAEAARHVRALGLGKIGSTNVAARPARDPRHARPGAAPRARRGDRDEAPRPEARAGLEAAEAPRRSRHRRQGRQDRRPGQQGPGRARHRRRPGSRVARRRCTAARRRRRASTTRSGSSTTS